MKRNLRSDPNSEILFVMARYEPVGQSDRDSLDISSGVPSRNSNEVATRLLDDEESCEKENADNKIRAKRLIDSISTYVLIASFVVFVCSVIIYGMRLYTAVSDKACDKRFWPYSMFKITNLAPFWRFLGRKLLT